MTSNRVKAAARRLQADEGIPYAEALRRVATPAPIRSATEHECELGLWLTDDGDRRKVCPECATQAQVARVVAVHRAARALKIIPQTPGTKFAWGGADWPYGAHVDLDSREALVAWAGPLGLRASSTSRECLHWLQGRHCPPRVPGRFCTAFVPGADHVTAWNRGAGRNPAVLVSQPYVLDDESREQLVKINESPGLRVDIDEKGGWYGEGTILVAIWRADRHPASAER